MKKSKEEILYQHNKELIKSVGLEYDLPIEDYQKESLWPFMLAAMDEYAAELRAELKRTRYYAVEAKVLLQCLVDLQNGPPLYQHRDQYNDCMGRVWEFLNPSPPKTEKE